MKANHKNILVRYSLFAVLLFLLFSTLYALSGRLGNLPGIPEAVLALSIVTFLGIIYINESLQLLKIRIFKVSNTLYKVTVVLLISSFMWSIQDYLLEYTRGNVDATEDIFLILVSILGMKFYMLLKAVISNSEYRMLTKSLQK